MILEKLEHFGINILHTNNESTSPIKLSPSTLLSALNKLNEENNVKNKTNDKLNKAITIVIETIMRKYKIKEN